VTPLTHLPLASESLLEDRTLLHRVDTKFILRATELPALVGDLNPDEYGVASHLNGGMLRYENLYFDTPNRSLLRAHHRGQRPRYKVRFRHHLSRELSYFELKQKKSSGVTAKVRHPVDYRVDTLGEDDLALVQSQRRIDMDNLQPAMRIGFERGMLVGLDRPERISVDTGLWFSDGPSRVQLDELVIIEVKQARFAARSPIMRALREHGALQLRVSKYVTGAQLLWPDVRLHRYRNRLRMLRRRIAS